MNMINTIKNSDFIISFGSFIARDKQEVNDAVIEAIAKESAEFIYMHPMDDIDIKFYYTQFVKYEVGSEEGVVTMLLDTFVKESNIKVEAYIEDLDMGYISAESSVGEEELEEILIKSQDKKSKILLIGDDILSHDRVTNIIKILALIKKYSSLEVIAVDEALQVLIDTCLDDEIEEVNELKSYNGTLIYKYFDNVLLDSIVGSASFAQVAKIQNNDEISFNENGIELKKVFVLDPNLQGTIALCANSIDTKSSVCGYRYKQVKIQKVDSNE